MIAIPSQFSSGLRAVCPQFPECGASAASNPGSPDRPHSDSPPTTPAHLLKQSARCIQPPNYHSYTYIAS